MSINRPSISQVRFAPLSGGGVEHEPNLELLREMKLEVMVELGRTSIPLRQVIQLGEGSIIELELPQPGPRRLKVLERVAVDAKRVVFIVGVGQRQWLIAAADDHVAAIA